MVLESKALALEKNGVQSFSFGDKSVGFQALSKPEGLDSISSAVWADEFYYILSNESSSQGPFSSTSSPPFLATLKMC